MSSKRGLHSTEVAILLLTQRPQVRFSAFPRKLLLMFLRITTVDIGLIMSIELAGSKLVLQKRLRRRSYQFFRRRRVWISAARAPGLPSLEKRASRRRPVASRTVVAVAVDAKAALHQQLFVHLHVEKVGLNFDDLCKRNTFRHEDIRFTDLWPVRSNFLR